MIEPVNFEVGGQVIRGSFHLSERMRGPFPAVLMLHGFTGQRMEAHYIFVKASRLFEGDGIASLRFDFRGCGESDGHFREVTLTRELDDATAAFNFLLGKRGVDPARVGVLGISMGAVVAALLTGREGRIRSCVLWSAPSNLEPAYEALRPQATVEQADVEEGAVSPGSRDIGGVELSEAFFKDILLYDPVAAVARSSAPVLVCHGSADPVVPVSHAEAYSRMLGGGGRRFESLIVEGANHVFGSLRSERLVLERSCRWLKETL